MNRLSNIREPQRLTMTWQPPEASPHARTRRVVAEVLRCEHGYVFRYLPNSEDYIAAIKGGFQGYPAFRLSTELHDQGVVEAFSRRLPPRKREDFGEFLEKHSLPQPFPLSDFALIGYTGASLPSDGFSFVPDFGDNPLPFEYVTELAGVRHVRGNDISDVSVGDQVTFAPDTENSVDRDAVYAVQGGLPLGYVNRVLRKQVAIWLASDRLSARVERCGRIQNRPFVYVRLEYR